jgi:DNA-3-methyladenine glycosylase II
MNSKNRIIPSRKKILQHFDKNDAVMAQLIRESGPIKLKRNRNYFKVLCNAIIGQQISVAAADAITTRFNNLFDGSSPTSQEVMKLAEIDLRKVGLSKQKVAYLKDLSFHFYEKNLRPHRLHYMDNDEVICQLTQVHGVGRWTAEMFLIFSLNRPDVLPVGDLGLQLALKKLYRMRKLPSVKRMQSIGKKWNPFETVGTWYAWRAQDEKDVSY